MTSTAVSQNVSAQAHVSKTVSITVEIPALDYNAVAASLTQRDVALYGAIQAKKFETAKINRLVANFFESRRKSITKAMANALVLDDRKDEIEAKLLDIQRAQREAVSAK